jgi:hypothetical protein
LEGEGAKMEVIGEVYGTARLSLRKKGFLYLLWTCLEKNRLRVEGLLRAHYKSVLTLIGPRVE